MTPSQFKQARQSLGLSQSELAAILNTTDRTVRKWENDERGPNPIACRVVEWMQDGYRPPQWPDKVRAS